MAIKITLDDAEINAAIVAHLKSKIPTADAGTVEVTIVAARQPNGPYADVSFEFEGAASTVSVKKSVEKKSPVKAETKVEAEPEPEKVAEVVEDKPPFEEDEIETSEKEDAADDAAAEELAEEEKSSTDSTKKKSIFSKRTS